MLAAVSMCTHFCLYLWGAQFTLRTDSSQPDCPVSLPEGQAGGSGLTSALLDQPFAYSAMED